MSAKGSGISSTWRWPKERSSFKTGALLLLLGWKLWFGWKLGDVNHWGNWVLFVDVPEKWLTHRYVSPPVLPVIPRVGIENSGRRLCERMTMPRSVRAGVPECSQTDSMQHPKSQTITTSPLEQSVKTSPGCSMWLAWGGMGPI